jgi:predicted nuclease of predicted toxin-antitoxin system
LADPDIFSKAIAEERIVVTFDLDFGEIASYTRGLRASVILFRLRNTRVHHVIDRIALVLREASEALAQGAVLIVEDGRFRVRRYPEL